MKSELCKIIGENTQKLRRKNSYSQESFSNEINISLSHYRDIEHGKGNPTLFTIRKICARFNLTLPELLCKADEKDDSDLALLQQCFLENLPDKDQEMLRCVLGELIDLLLTNKEKKSS